VTPNLLDMRGTRLEMKRTIDVRQLTPQWSFTREFAQTALRAMLDDRGERVYSTHVVWDPDRKGGRFDGVRFSIADSQKEPALLIAYDGDGKAVSKMPVKH
jgi:hypothetical protein